MRVCVQNPDCQCRTTLQVKQCRIIRDTEGQRGGVREVRKEGDGEKEKEVAGERDEETRCGRLCIQMRKSGGSEGILQVNFQHQGVSQTCPYVDLLCPTPCPPSVDVFPSGPLGT